MDEITNTCKYLKDVILNIKKEKILNYNYFDVKVIDDNYVQMSVDGFNCHIYPIYNVNYNELKFLFKYFIDIHYKYAYLNIFKERLIKIIQQKSIENKPTIEYYKLEYNLNKLL